MDIRNVLMIVGLLVILFVVIGSVYDSNEYGYENDMMSEEVEDVEVEGFAASESKHAQVLRDHTDAYTAKHSTSVINGDYEIDNEYDECLTPNGSSAVIRPYGCESTMMEMGSVAARDSNGVVVRDEFVYPYSNRIHEPLDMVVDERVHLEYSILTPHMKTRNQVNDKEGDFRHMPRVESNLDFESVPSVIEAENMKRLESIRNGFEFSPENPAKDTEQMY